MSYQKLLVDNTTCSRRFHLTFDDAGEKLPRVEARCRFCNVVIFSEENHPAVSVAREENLVKTSTLSELLITECDFKDSFSEKTVSGHPGGAMYKPQGNA